MITINITNFRKGLSTLLKQTIHSNEPIHITTKDGNAVLISEKDYNSLTETLYLTKSEKMKKKLIEGKNTPLSNCVAEEEVDW